MKNNLIVLILIVSFFGCNKKVKHIKDELDRVDNISVETVDEIISKEFLDQFGNMVPIWFVKHSINYPNENNTGDIDDPYRIGFHFKHKKKIEDGTFMNHSYDLCKDSPKEYLQNIENYRGYTVLVDESEVFHLYLAVETMQKRGFIDSSLKSKGDICIYINATNETMNKIEKYESNTLVFNKEEIDKVLEEYRALQ